MASLEGEVCSLHAVQGQRRLSSPHSARPLPCHELAGRRRVAWLGATGGGVASTCSSYHGWRYPAEVIQHAVCEQPAEAHSPPDPLSNRVPQAFKGEKRFTLVSNTFAAS